MTDKLLDQLRHIRKFQMDDLKRALWDAKANFLVAAGAMNVIEFLGGLHTGDLGKKGKVKARFLAGTRLLGADYTAFGEDDLYEARCGLIHQYLYEDKRYTDFHVSAAVWKPAFQVAGSVLTVHVGQMLDDLDAGWDSVLRGIQADPKARRLAEESLSRLPHLD